MRCLRLAAARQVLSFGIALALLGLAVPDAGAQQFTSRNPDKDFNTLGVVGNKGPQGLWSDGTTMLVSDIDGKIYSYALANTERQDSHHNDRLVGTPAAAEEGEGANADDFILYKDGSTTETIRPYGLWSTNSTLWVASTEGSRTNKTAKLYAYTMTWNESDVRTDLDGNERYLKGTRDSTKDIDLHRQTDSLPDLNDNGNPIVYEEFVNNGTTNRTLLTYGSVTNIISGETNIVYHLLNKDRNRLTPNSEGKLTTQDGVVYENGNISFQTNMVTGPVGNISPTGIWSDGTTIWVADQGDLIKFESIGEDERFISPDKIYAYKLTLGEGETEEDRRVPAKDIQLSVASGSQASYDYTLDKNTYAQGLWSDGNTMWVANTRGAADSDEKRIYAYNMWTNSPTGGRMFDGSRDPAKDYKNLNKEGNINDNDRPRGIWSDGETMWVADQTDNKLYAYHAYLALTSRNEKQDFGTNKTHLLKAAGNNTPKGMWSDGQTLWVVDGDDDKLYAYNLATKARDSNKEIDLAESMTDLENGDNSDPSGIWSDRTTIWVADGGDDKLYAYNLSGETRFLERIDGQTVYSKDIPLDSNNSNPSGLWANETIIWVADSVFTTASTVRGKSITRKKLFAYKRELGEGETERRVPDRDIDLDQANSDPSDIWSDKTTMWVADTVDDKLYAYDLDTGDRVFFKDFGTLDSENTTPTGLWSDGATMWVVDNHPTNPKRDKIYAYRLSNAASLGALELTGHVPSEEYEDFEEVRLQPSFDSGTTRYTASVPYATESLTVSPRTLRPVDHPADGVFSISPVDADATKNGHQVNLTVGENTISITVSNAGTDTTSLPRTRTYTVVVTREFFTYNDPLKNFTLHSANSTPRGIFSDGTTLWVANDDEDDKIYAYKLSDKSRDSGKDIALAVSTTSLDEEDNSHPRGIWANATTMWVVDFKDDKIYAYKLELGEGETERHDSGKDITLVEDNSDPQWIWSDGVTMWVSDSMDNKLYAYKLRLEAGETEANHRRDSNKDVSLAGRSSGISDPTGMWADGASLWIADNDDAKIYAHKINEDGDAIDCWEEVRDFNTLKDAGNLNPQAIFSDRSTMYVVDIGEDESGDEKIFAYNQPLSANNKLKRLELSGVYKDETSMTISEVFSSGAREFPYNAYVVYSTASTTVTAIAQDPDAGVEITPKDQDLTTPGHQINLADGDNTITITVTAENAAVQEYTVNVRRRYNDGRLPFRDFNFLTKGNTNANPTGLWSDGTNMWVLDGTDKKFYVYKMADNEWGKRDGDKGFELEMSNSTPGDIWSTNGVMWVPNREPGKIYAYDLNASANHYHSSEDFNTLSSSTNKSPRGLWSDGTTMWVVDDTFLAGTNFVRKIFAYNLNLEARNKPRVANKEFTLSVDNESPWGIWSNRTNMWVLDRDDKKLYAYKMLGENRGDPDPSKNIGLLKDITLNGEGESVRSYLGNPRGIWSNGEIMWVSDSVDKKIYAYDMNADVSGNSDVSNDSTLKDLRLSGIGLNPVFSPDKEIYTALVDHTVNTTTVTATPNDSGSSVIIFSGVRGTTRSTADKGPQVSLQEGYNIIAIDVTAENGISRSTYLIEVTKAEAPPVSGGPLPQPQSFQPSATSSASQPGLTGSAAGIREGESRLIFAEPLPNGGVRFVFLVSAEEFQMEETDNLLTREWRPLPEDTFQSTRESLGDGQDRLTIILPEAAGKQRFLRLSPQR